MIVSAIGKVHVRFRQDVGILRYVLQPVLALIGSR